MTARAPSAIEEVEQRTLPPIRPRSGWYALGGAVVAGGLVTAFLLLVSGAFGYLRQIEDLARVPLPGPAEVALDAGDLIVYHEPDDGRLYVDDDLGLLVTTTDGEEITVTARTTDDRYSTEDRRGAAAAAVRIERPGTYMVAVTSEASGELAIGSEPGRRLTTYGLTALAVAGLAIVAGAAIVVVVRRRRRRSRAARLAWQQVHQAERFPSAPSPAGDPGR